MRAVDTFGVLRDARLGDLADRPQLHSVQPPSDAVMHGVMKNFNRTFNKSFESARAPESAHRNRALLSGKAQFPVLEATPVFGVQGPAVGPVRLHGAPAYGQRPNAEPNLGQTPGVVCEKTPDGAVCSDGTYQSATCAAPQAIASAAPAGSTEKAAVSPASYALPVAIGAGVLGIAAYFFLK